MNQRIDKTEDDFKVRPNTEFDKWMQEVCPEAMYKTTGAIFKERSEVFDVYFKLTWKISYSTDANILIVTNISDDEHSHLLHSINTKERLEEFLSYRGII